MATRIWLDVPFSEKDGAKAAGAQWDGQAKRWYAPRPGMSGLDSWCAVEAVPPVLAGEDRALGSGLFVDLVPSSCWFTNARSCVAEKDWERLRRMVTERAGRRCEVCGAPEDRGSQRWLEVHERWAYDDVTRVQSLRRLICLCTPCHIVTHFGRAELRGMAAPAREHLMEVSGLSGAEADQQIAQAFDVWQVRSRCSWALDLSILIAAGITVATPPSPQERAAEAKDDGQLLPRNADPRPRDPQPTQK